MQSLALLATYHGHIIHSYMICQSDHVVIIVQCNGLLT